MFSDTGRKEAAILVRGFLRFLCGQPDKYMTSGSVVFDALVQQFAQLPLPKNTIVFQEYKNHKYSYLVFSGAAYFLFVFGEPRLGNCAASTRQPL